MLSLSIALLILLGSVTGPLTLLVEGQTGVDPPNSWNPLLFEDSFMGEVDGADPASWVVTESLATEIEIETSLFSSSVRYREVLRVSETDVGGRAGASTPVLDPPNYFSIGFEVNVSSVACGICTYETSFTGSTDTILGSGVFFGIVIKKDRSINYIGQAGQADTGQDLQLGVWYGFRYVVNVTSLRWTLLWFNHSSASSFSVLQGDIPIGSGFTGDALSLNAAAGSQTTQYLDRATIGIPSVDTEPVSESCSQIQYVYEVSSDADEVLAAVVSARDPNGEVTNFLVAQISAGDPIVRSRWQVAGIYTVILYLENTGGLRYQNYTLTITDCQLGPAYGYSGISSSLISGATYFDNRTGRVKPIPTHSLILSYDMSTLDSNGDLYDFSGYGNSGTINGPTPILGTFGYGLSFDGINDNVTLSDAAILDRPSEFTIHAWITLEGESTNRTLWSKWDNIDNEGWLLQFNESNIIYFSFGGSENYSFAVLLSVNTSFAFTLTYDDQDFRIYLDGDLEGTFPEPDHGPGDNSANPSIGDWQGTEWLNATILDEYLMWSEALSDPQVDGLGKAYPQNPIFGRPDPPGDPTLSLLESILPAMVVTFAVVGLFISFGTLGIHIYRGLRGRR